MNKIITVHFYLLKKKLLYIYAILYKLPEQLAVQQVTELFTGRVIFKQELQTLLLVMSKCTFFTFSINFITQPNVITHTNDIPSENTDRKPKFTRTYEYCTPA